MKVNYSKTPQQLFNEIETNGFARIDNAIAPDELQNLKEFVTELILKNNGSFTIVGHDNLSTSLLSDLYKDKQFLQFQSDLVSLKVKEEIKPTENKYQVLRVLNGGNVNSQSHLFHFDNYTLTILLPIIIPNDENNKNGDLLVLPNIRKVSNSPNKDAMIKIITQNPITRKLLKFKWVRDMFNFKSLKLEPGHLYFFWGFSSYHGNDDCNDGSIRSTALFHFHKTVRQKSLFSTITSTKKRARVKV
jgi:hypothetical protein